MSPLVEAFGVAQGNWEPAPSGVQVHSTAAAYREISSGDHVVVLRGGTPHHGIVVGNLDPQGNGMHVVDMGSPSHDKKMRDARLQISTFEKFLAGYATFGVVPYAPADSTAEDKHRAIAARRAQVLAAAPPDELHVFNIIAKNPESFAWLCKTGEYNATPKAVKRVLNTIRLDMKRAEKAFKLQTTPKKATGCALMCLP